MASAALSLSTSSSLACFCCESASSRKQCIRENIVGSSSLSMSTIVFSNTSISNAHSSR